MASEELKYFEELKKEVAAAFQKSYPHCKSDIGEWKGQDIVDFQEDLIKKVQGRISEKWFYTHIKAPTEKLPRIDMLNMLSQYAGYKNWANFVGTKNISEHTTEVKREIPEPSQALRTEAAKPHRNNKYWIAAGIIAFVTIVFITLFSSSGHIYKCCFVDLDGNTPIKNKVRIAILKENESPVYAETANGCLELIEKDNKIKFVISTPYFKPDTFSRTFFNENTEDVIQLKTDDYSLMIHYFSKSNVDDWKKRRMQLDEMIADNAKVFQVYVNSEGMELYNKQEFIDKMTMPLKSLKDIEIFDVKYADNKITELRFSQLVKDK